jgi:hypothetical protein
MATISISTPSDGQTIDASDVNSPLNTIVAAINGNLDNDNIATGANISGTKLAAASVPLSALDATARGGWISGVLAAPNTVTYNGNRNYSLVFNSTDYTDELSNGMKLRFVRTVTAPTQCTDLEAGSSQYYSKTSPANISFTTTYTCMAWIKLESYTRGGIIARRNGDTEGWSFGVSVTGQLTLESLRIAGNNKLAASDMALPLNKWIHVAATMDVSVAGNSSTTMYIDGQLVTATVTTNGTATALVQGTTALVVGAEKSAGTNPFDGKIAQAAVFSTVLSAATINSYATQTLSGSETSLISAYSFNNVITDLNTTNANNLTANGSAVATNVDSPFAGGANASTAYTAGTTEFGEVFNVSFSTNTTVVVQVPEGYSIPTSGGITSVAYSTAEKPLGWPGLGTVLAWAMIMNNATATTIAQILGLSVTGYIPAGRKAKVVVHTGQIQLSGAGTTTVTIWDGVVSSGTQVASGANSNGTPSLTENISTPPLPQASAGNKTYNAALTASAGTATITATAVSPAYIELRLD